jgi:hypothetical protein
MHGPINVKSPNNISKWQMGFNSAFKGLNNVNIQNTSCVSTCESLLLICILEGKPGGGGKILYIDKGEWKMLNRTRNIGVKRWRTRDLDRIEWASKVREAKPAQKKNLNKNAQITNYRRKHKKIIRNLI